MNSFKIIVLGACGHIGSRLIRSLIGKSFETNCEIIVVDDLRTQRFCGIFNLYQKDLTKNTIRFYFEDAIKFVKDLSLTEGDVIINLAAITDAEGSVGMEDIVYKNNFGIVKSILDNPNLASARKIFLSSTSVYGSQDTLVDESCSELLPQSPYAESKIQEEKYILDSGDRNSIILRFGTIFGASPGMRFHTAVNKFCFQAAYDLPVTVWRSALHQKRPYLGLEDACRAIEIFIEDKFISTDIFNVITNNFTVNDILDSIKRIEPNLEISFVDSKIMNQLSYEVSADKIYRLGFKPSSKLHEETMKTLFLLNPKYKRSIEIF